MIHIQYVGPKPVISSSGISFETKADKFEFIEPAAHVLHMFIDLHSQITTEQIRPSDPLSEQEILRILYSGYPDFDAFHDEQLRIYEEKLDEEESEAMHKENLDEIERQTLIKNLQYMRPYRMQRASNKLVYEAFINRAVELMKEKEIFRVKTPFSTGFLHVLGSLESTLKLQKVPPRTTLEVKLDRGHPYSELVVDYDS